MPPHPPIPVLPRRSLSSNTRTRAFLSMEGSRLTKASTSSSRTPFLSLAFNSGGYTLRLSVPRASSPKILENGSTCRLDQADVAVFALVDHVDLSGSRIPEDQKSCLEVESCMPLLRIHGLATSFSTEMVGSSGTRFRRGLAHEDLLSLDALAFLSLSLERCFLTWFSILSMTISMPNTYLLSLRKP